ncbi:unnamed protein product [Adineta steineri]|uniref:Uncharacterized protein n=1 Tax=Adineta steineri TaxID=433720 RepID=A0A818SWB6_9BILA|nr:unnamed protein product [Adineta steineri]CAF3674434.1 unnamed protein product [Adineta steineri]
MASFSAFKDSTSQFFERVTDTTKKVKETIEVGTDYAGNKWNESSTITKTCIIGVPTAVIAPFAIIPVLGAAGFTSAGVVAGSLAASLQTATTVSGSIFALCQSAGAVGAVATSTSVGVGLTAGATVGGVTAAVFRKHDSNNKNDKSTKTEDDNEKVIENNINVVTATSVDVGLEAGLTAGGVITAVCNDKDSNNKNDKKTQTEDNINEFFFQFPVFSRHLFIFGCFKLIIFMIFSCSIFIFFHSRVI